MGTITLIAGGLLTGITLGLFELIQINIEQFYGEYIVVSGLRACPYFRNLPGRYQSAVGE